MRSGYHGAGLNDESMVEHQLQIEAATAKLLRLVKADPDAAEAFCGVIDTNELMEFLSDEEDDVDHELTRRVTDIRNAVMDLIQSNY